LSTPQLRTIVEDDSFCSAFEKLKVAYQRLDEVLVGVGIALARHPEHCPVIKGTVLSVIKTRPFPAIPALRVFFTYDDGEVHLRHVEIIQHGAPEPKRDEE
jgi:hypothetical protein